MDTHAFETPDVIGMLARTVATRLIDISRTGCLLESRQRVENGTVGELRLQVDRDVFVDDVRVTRCVLVKGSGSLYLVGAEFLQTHRPGERSIRLAVGAILRGLTAVHKGRRDERRVTSDGGERGAPPSVVNSVHPTGEKAS